jgi:hypothetical protein
MPDLEDQLRAYGRLIEQHVADSADAAEGSLPSESAAGRTPPVWRSPWFLVAAATAAVAVAASLLLPATRPEGGSDMNNKVSGTVVGTCLILAACTSGADATGPSTSAAAQPSSSLASASPTTSSMTPGGLPLLFDQSGSIEPGTYVVDGLGFPLQLTVTEPDWVTREEAGAIEGPETAYIGWAATTSSDTAYVWTDACDYRDKSAPVGPTVDDYVAAVVAQLNTDTTEPRPIEFAGYSGVELQLRLSPGVDLKTCIGGTTTLWGDNPDFGLPGPVEQGATVTTWALDLGDGKRGIINFGANEVLSADVQAQLDSMVASMQSL